MSSVAQLVAVGLAVAAAGVYVARAAWRTWSGGAAGKGCGSGCGKCAATPPEPKRDGRFPLPQV
jgi:hypothetical protein